MHGSLAFSQQQVVSLAAQNKELREWVKSLAEGMSQLSKDLQAAHERQPGVSRDPRTGGGRAGGDGNALPHEEPEASYGASRTSPLTGCMVWEGRSRGRGEIQTLQAEGAGKEPGGPGTPRK